MIEEGGGLREKPQKSYGRDVENERDSGGRKKYQRQKSVGSVNANPKDPENSKEAVGEAQETRGLSKNCTSRQSVSPLSRLIRRFRNKFP